MREQSLVDDFDARAITGGPDCAHGTAGDVHFKPEVEATAVRVQRTRKRSAFCRRPRSGPKLRLPFPRQVALLSAVGSPFHPIATGVAFPRALVVVCVGISAVAGLRAAQAGKLRFNRDIRPILSENCFQCHGPDSNRRKGDLRLDVREAAVEAMAFVPGHAEKSEMIRRVFESDPDEQMPPAESNRSLTAAQKELLKRWVKEGASYEAHWAYEVPVRPPLPQPKAGPRPLNPIDAFVL